MQKKFLQTGLLAKALSVSTAINAMEEDVSGGSPPAPPGRYVFYKLSV